MTHDPRTPSSQPSSGPRIARRESAATGPVASVATLFPPEPPPPAPAHPESRATLPESVTAPGSHGLQTTLVAAALVVALAASVGVAVLWAANARLTADVEAAVAQAEAAEQEADDLRTAFEAAPDAATVDALTGRVDSIEDWTGLPPEGASGTADLQTRLLDVSTGIESLESNLRDGLGTVRNDLAAVRNDVAADDDEVSADEVDALRQELSGLRDAVDDVRGDLGVLCWALGHSTDVTATC